MKNFVAWFLCFVAIGMVSVIRADDDVCRLPMAPGICRASIPRYYYDAALKDCVTFIYGGCHGNGNSFVSYEECKSKCKA